MTNLIETTKEINLEIPKKLPKRKIMWNYYFREILLTFWRERSGKQNYYLDNYIENNLPIRTLSYPSDVRGISDSRWEITSRRDWKIDEIGSLSGLLGSGRLIFGNEEARKAFIKEYNSLNK